jgi:hypothetical protein
MLSEEINEDNMATTLFVALEKLIHNKNFTTLEIQSLTRGKPSNQIKQLIDEIVTECNSCYDRQEYQRIEDWSKAYFSIVKDLPNNKEDCIRSYYFGALANYELQNFPIVKIRLDKAIELFSTNSEIEGSVYYLYALLKFNLSEYDNALQYTQKSHAIYQKCSFQSGIDNCHTLIQQIQQSKTPTTPVVSISDAQKQLLALHQDIAQAQQKLTVLQDQITLHTQQFEAQQQQFASAIIELQTQRDFADKERADYERRLEFARAEFSQKAHLLDKQFATHQADIAHQKNTLTQSLEAHQQQITLHKQQREHEIQQLDHQWQALYNDVQLAQNQVALWQTSQIVPFWLAIIRLELQQNTVSVQSRDFLKKLYTLAPAQAIPVFAELEARGLNKTVPLYDLAPLTGETRLFAALANAKQLHAQDEKSAIETVIDGWEVFLGGTI